MDYIITFVKIALIFLIVCIIYPIIYTLVNISYEDDGRFTLEDEMDYEEAQKIDEELQIKAKIEEGRKLK